MCLLLLLIVLVRTLGSSLLGAESRPRSLEMLGYGLRSSFIRFNFMEGWEKYSSPIQVHNLLQFPFACFLQSRMMGGTHRAPSGWAPCRLGNKLLRPSRRETASVQSNPRCQGLNSAWGAVRAPLRDPCPAMCIGWAWPVQDSQGRWPQSPGKCLGEAAQEDGEELGNSMAVSCSGPRHSTVRI